jgi:hypothetical protein
MNRTEALKIISTRNKLRKEAMKLNNALWKAKFGSPQREALHVRYMEVIKANEDLQDNAREAMSFFLKGEDSKDLVKAKKKTTFKN